MKNQHLKISLAILIAMMSFSHLAAQPAKDYSRMMRIYWDNDFFAYQKEDGAYTNGIRADFFYTRNRARRSFFDKLFLSAGKDAVNTFSWSIMQTMVTSNDITKKEYESRDYPYSGALFIMRGVNSVNSRKQYGFRTEWLVGVMGPRSFAAETQTWFHRSVIRSPRPMGWDHQLPTTVLLNFDASYEKMLLSTGRVLEVIGGADLYAGTALDAVSIQSTIRVGKMKRYFDGFISRFNARRQVQAYLIARPRATVTFHDTMLEGPIFKSIKNSVQTVDGEVLPESEATRVSLSIDYGVAASYGPFGFSFALNTGAGLIKHQPMKTMGTVTLSASW